MDYILSTDTTTTAITKINLRLTGGTFDDSYLLWKTYSGGTIVKRDNLYPNTAITTNNFIEKNLIVGGNNTALTNSNYSTIFAGTGNTINYFNNNIFAGERNSFSEISSYSSPGVGSSSIFGGVLNVMSGITFTPDNSSILNGSGNTIINESLTYDVNYGRNSILNGVSNKIKGIVGNSWIGNGSANTISTTSVGKTKGNFILNGSGNTITSSLSSGADYNTIIGGTNNTISNKTNSIIVGSNLNGATDFTSVNRMFYDKKMSFNSYTYVSSYSDFTFNHNNKSVGIIKNLRTGDGLGAGVINVTLQNGTYNGQILYLIGIPSTYTYGINVFTGNIILYSASTGGNIISDTISVPGSDGTTRNYVVLNCHQVQEVTNGEDWSGLGIFVWDGTYWIRADYRGGFF